MSFCGSLFSDSEEMETQDQALEVMTKLRRKPAAQDQPRLRGGGVCPQRHENDIPENVLQSQEEEDNMLAEFIDEENPRRSQACSSGDSFTQEPSRSGPSPSPCSPFRSSRSYKRHTASCSMRSFSLSGYRSARFSSRTASSGASSPVEGYPRDSESEAMNVPLAPHDLNAEEQVLVEMEPQKKQVEEVMTPPVPPATPLLVPLRSIDTDMRPTSDDVEGPAADAADTETDVVAVPDVEEAGTPRPQPAPQRPMCEKKTTFPRRGRHFSFHRENPEEEQ